LSRRAPERRDWLPVGKDLAQWIGKNLKQERHHGEIACIDRRPAGINQK